ncbi:unnamed protein product [Ceutorhynchus assimilis]|uniref:Dynein intermediate chain 2, ciliary n=1 Tax=Ceutorhynchus assimilis TaxID=467358 RepID=A0A9N9MQG7_9CUCU|nr:unnamed protein product [Ceutorhynchus assimilis]
MRPKHVRSSAKVGSDAYDEIEEWRRAKQLLKPKEQLELNEGELKEVIAKQLCTVNPQSPDSLIEFNYDTGEFLPIALATQGIVLFESLGTVLHKDSEEAYAQLLEQGIDPQTYEGSVVSLQEEDVVAEPEPKEEDEGKGIKTEAGEEEEEGEAKDEETEEETQEKAEEDAEVDEEAEAKVETAKPIQKGGKPRKLVNQFNFCERAALTYNNPVRAQANQTVPPPIAKFSANVLQWNIYDEYQKDFEAQQLEKELERERKEKEKAPVSKHQPQKKGQEKFQLNEAVQGRISECWKVLERMINQNTYDDIAQDYRYWDDPADEFRDGEGTLLPLWKFSYAKTRKSTVIDIDWNPIYYDLYQVSYGSFDFLKPAPEGAVCLFTIKNPSFPDYICMTECGVMCSDFHPTYPYMVVMGLYDGSVLVYNVQASCQIPAFKSDNVTNKHKGIVWDVKWAPDLPDGELNFYSVSCDGDINNWVLMQNELAVTTILSLGFDNDPVIGPDGTHLKLKCCASCIRLYPKDPSIYLVGTEEGHIYKCSTEYSSICLLTYKAHLLPVNRIDFNKYNPDIFISCSGDWKIKIWENNRTEALFVFDLGYAVGDVKWAPFSSTVFAAVTSEGKVYVYDLNVNKYKPICVQAVVSRRRFKLTRLSFNQKLPIIIVGDDKGCVTSLKLSPNLRIACKAPKKQQYLDQWTMQCMKLDKLLSVVQESETLLFPEDTAGKEES